LAPVPGYNYEALSDDGYIYKGAYNSGHPDPDRHVELRLYKAANGNAVLIGKHKFTGPNPWETEVVIELYQTDRA
jgi:hypothetical protein